jgi:hypothetical protein
MTPSTSSAEQEAQVCPGFGSIPSSVRSRIQTVADEPWTKEQETWYQAPIVTAKGVRPAPMVFVLLTHLLVHRVVGRRVVLDRDEGRHAAHGVHAALVAGRDEQLDVVGHERRGHGDLRAVRQDEVLVVAKLLDVAEDVVPTTAVDGEKQRRPLAMLRSLIQRSLQLATDQFNPAECSRSS